MQLTVGHRMRVAGIVGTVRNLVYENGEIIAAVIRPDEMGDRPWYIVDLDGIRINWVEKI